MGKAKTQRKHRAETLVQKAQRSENWGNDPVYLEWQKAHRKYRQALKDRGAWIRALRRSGNRGGWWLLRQQYWRGLDDHKSVIRYLPKTAPLSAPQPVSTCACHRSWKDHRIKTQKRAAEKAAKLHQQPWDELRQREWQEYQAKLQGELSLDRPVDETLPQAPVMDVTQGSVDAGVKNPFRQKYYYVDEFGYGYLDDK